MASPCWPLVLFTILFFLRYLRLLVGVYANLIYKSYLISRSPSHVGGDVSVIIPTTFKDADGLLKCLRSIGTSASQIIIVTADARVKEVRRLCIDMPFSAIKVLGQAKLNKRRQLLAGLEHVHTPIVVFADDDVIWPQDYLSHLLAIFEDRAVGARGTRQRVKRAEKPDIWNFLAISYLERRVFNNITTQAIDGSISTLSGRTAAYRTSILKNDKFYHYFLNDSWLGRPLNTDDDKCLTRYVYSNGWKIAIQRSAVIETTMESGWTYIEQCKRWARAHWRGNFVVMSNERYWCSWRYLWGFYAIYMAQFQTPAILVDGLLIFLLHNSSLGSSRTISALVIWIVITKLIKLSQHFTKYPQDLVFVPASILFSYLHGVINIYALLTLHVTCWGSQQLSEMERPENTKQCSESESEPDTQPLLAFE